MAMCGTCPPSRALWSPMKVSGLLAGSAGRRMRACCSSCPDSQTSPLRMLQLASLWPAPPQYTNHRLPNGVGAEQAGEAAHGCHCCGSCGRGAAGAGHRPRSGGGGHQLAPAAGAAGGGGPGREEWFHSACCRWLRRLLAVSATLQGCGCPPEPAALPPLRTLLASGAPWSGLLRSPWPLQARKALDDQVPVQRITFTEGTARL